MSALRLKNLLHLFVLAGLLTACKGGDGASPNNGYNRDLFLQEVASKQIVPAYADLVTKTSVLQSAARAFVTERNVGNYQALCSAWIGAYNSFMYANAYNIGPAAEDGLRKELVEEIGTFPISPTKVEAYVAAGSVNLNDFNRDARGFLGVEYLLFERQTQGATLAAFEDSNRCKVLVQMVDHIYSRVTTVSTAWAGSYKTDFVTNTGTEAGSSVSILYNAFVKSFESTKNFKVGLPLGKRPGQVSAEPMRVEGYYSGQSLTFLKSHLLALENLWQGVDKRGDTLQGFKHYLLSVEGGPALVGATEKQIASYKASLAALPPGARLSDLILQQPALVDSLHTELQKQTRFYKSDMSSLLGIAITYASGDGD